MRAGLAASTVTPGRTAPVASLTTPAILPLVSVCPDTKAGRSVSGTMKAPAMKFLLMRSSPDVRARFVTKRDALLQYSRTVVNGLMQQDDAPLRDSQCGDMNERTTIGTTQVSDNE